VIDLKSKARTGCRRCHGLGYTGTAVATGRPMVCQCVRVALRVEAEKGGKNPFTPPAPGNRFVGPDRAERLRAEIKRLEDKAFEELAVISSCPEQRWLLEAEAELKAAEDEVRPTLEKLEDARSAKSQWGEDLLVLRGKIEALKVQAASLLRSIDDADREIQASQDLVSSHARSHEAATALLLARKRHGQKKHQQARKANVLRDKADKLRMRLLTISVESDTKEATDAPV
jgi:hypothetical protein